MKTLIQILVFPALLAILIFALFSQTGSLLDQSPLEESVLGVTHQRDTFERNIEYNQKLILFSSEFL